MQMKRFNLNQYRQATVDAHCMNLYAASCTFSFTVNPFKFSCKLKKKNEFEFQN